MLACAAPGIRTGTWHCSTGGTTNLRLHVIGAGTPGPTPDRFGSSYVVEYGGQYIMFDCGPATTHKLVKAGIPLTRIDNLFFTHHHFDHDVDYPCFLLSRWNLCIGDENELNVFGPNLTEQLTHRLMDEHEGAYAHDWIARINHPLSVNAFVVRGGTPPRPAPTVNANDVGPGKVTGGDGWEVTAAPAEHVQPYLDSLAYRLETDEGSVVVTGDTRPCKTVLDLARDCDTLICLCVYIQDDIDCSPEAEYMCGSTAAGQLAQDAGAKRMVLVHQADPLNLPGGMERCISDISKVYDGEVVWGEELMAVDL